MSSRIEELAVAMTAIIGTEIIWCEAATVVPA